MLKSKSEFTDINCTFEEDLSAHALWQAIDEPAFINVCVGHVGSTTIMEQPTEAVEVLSVYNDLAIIDEVVGLPDRHQLKLQSVWLVDLRGLIRELDVVEGLKLHMVFDPLVFDGEEVPRDWPEGELNVLVPILSEVSMNILILEQLLLVVFHFEKSFD